MFIAQSGISQVSDNSQFNKARVIEKAQAMAEMMRGCSCSLDPIHQTEALKLARALRTVLNKGAITLKDIGFTAAEINAIIVGAPNRGESVSSFGFLQEQMVEEAEALAEEVDVELVEDDQAERGEVSEVRRKPAACQSWICGNSREPHIRADMASLLGDIGDEQLTGMLDVLLPTG